MRARTSWLLLLLLLACTRAPKTAATSTEPEVAAGPVSLAVAPFAAAGDAAWVGIALADGIGRRAFLRDDIGSYTGRQVAAAMREARVTAAEMAANSEAALELGRHLGATVVVAGEVQPDGGYLQIRARADLVATGRVCAEESVRGSVARVGELEAKLAGLVARCVGGNLTGPPPPQAGLAEATRAITILRAQSLSPRAADPLAPMRIDAADLAQARNLATQAVAAAPQFGDGLAALALAEAMAGNVEGAWQRLEKAGDAPLPILARTFVRMRQGRFDAAEAILRAAMNEHPGFLHGQGSLAELMLHFGRLREARAEFRNYLEKAPGQPWVLTRIAYCSSRLGKHAEALAHARRAVELAPASAFLRTELASRQIDAEEYAAARETLSAALAMAPDDARAHVRMGYVQLVLGDDAGATHSSRRALELATGPRHSRDRAYAHLNLARALGHTGKVNDAIDHLESAAKEADVSFDEVELDPALAALREHPRYLGLFQ
jgi:tetratricopeptide (TPR) repeat protein